jgi:hypothetical protein
MKLVLIILGIMISASAEATVIPTPDICQPKQSECYQSSNSSRQDQDRLHATFGEGIYNLMKWQWLFGSVINLQKRNDLILDDMSRLRRSLAWSKIFKSSTPLQKMEGSLDQKDMEIKVNKLHDKFNLLVSILKEIKISRRRLHSLYLLGGPQKEITEDEERKLSSLESLKIEILSTTPQLAGKKIEKLATAMSSSEDEQSDGKNLSKDDFYHALNSDLTEVVLLLKKKDDQYRGFLDSYKMDDQTVDKLQIEPPDVRIDQQLFFDVLSVESFGQGNQSIISSDIPCFYIKQYNRNEKIEMWKDIAVDAALILTPILLGPVGIASRALLAARMLKWGHKAKKSAAFNSSFAMLGADIGIATYDYTLLSKRSDDCQAKGAAFYANPNRQLYEATRECEKDIRGDRVILMTGIALSAGIPLYRQMKIKKRLLSAYDGVSRQLPDYMKLSGRFSLLRGLKIRQQVEAVKRRVKVASSPLSREIIDKSSSVGKLVNDNATTKTLYGYTVIDKKLEKQYRRLITKDTVEFLYIPGTKVEFLPNAIQDVGHVALRVGDKVYHQTGTGGFKMERFSSFIHTTKGKNKVFGQVLNVSPDEMDRMKRYFSEIKSSDIPYSFIFNNCSQSACRALDIAEVTKIKGLSALDPSLAHQRVRRSERVAMKTVYNIDQDDSLEAINAAIRRNRVVFYGAPLLAQSGITYGGIEAVDLVIDHIESIVKESE